MNVINMRVSDLIPYANNPRNNKAAVEYVAKSISRFGFKVPIVVDKFNVVVAGHTRLLAAKQLKLSEVPCLVADDLTEDEIKAYRLADNKTAEFAEWDLDKLAEELNIIEMDMKPFGFENLTGPDEVTEDDYNVELPKEPRSKPGDLYVLGGHRVLCGNSTDSECVARLFGEFEADLVLTDPPYNVDYTGKTKESLKIQNDKMNDDSFLAFLTDAMTRMHEHSKKGAAVYIFHADSEGFNFRYAFKLAGYKLRQCLVWMKNSLVPGRQDYQWKHEPILYGWKEGAGHTWYSDRKQTTVVEFDRPTRNAEHPTMKPVGLCAYFIKNSSKEGDIVMDLFGGSGSTLIACEQTARRCFTMELDPRYVDVIVNRW